MIVDFALALAIIAAEAAVVAVVAAALEAFRRVSWEGPA